MLYFFTSYNAIIYNILKYFNIDITLFSDYERLVIILLSNILGFLIIWFSISFLYKFFIRFLGGFK